jgi:hypothetical protein
MLSLKLSRRCVHAVDPAKEATAAKAFDVWATYGSIQCFVGVQLTAKSRPSGWREKETQRLRFTREY